jgi:hypothetical protein
MSEAVVRGVTCGFGKTLRMREHREVPGFFNDEEIEILWPTDQVNRIEISTGC